MSRIVLCSLLLLFCIADQVKSKKFTDLQMFDKVINEIPDDNVVICPPAIDLALTQIYLAAGGATESKLKDTAAVSGASKESLCKSPFPSWATDIKPPVRIASRFYAHKDVHIQPTYKDNYTTYLNTEIENMEKSGKWAGSINSWVTSQIDQSVDNLIDPLEVEESRRAYLASAVSFSLPWEVPFKPIPDAMFYVTDESRSASVKMMQVVGNFKYYYETNLEFHTLLIPFAKSNLNLVLMVPKTSDGITKIEEGVKNIDVRKATVRNVNLFLPQFKFRYNRDMVQALIDLGIDKTVFGDTNLSELTTYNGKFKIETITTTTMINIDAKGISSAFATGVDVLASKPRTAFFDESMANDSVFSLSRQKRSPKPSKPASVVVIEVNRPFLFALMDAKRTYFFGRYSYPA